MVCDGLAVDVVHVLGHGDFFVVVHEGLAGRGRGKVDVGDLVRPLVAPVSDDA